MAVDRLIPSAADAARTYRALAQLPSPYGHGSHCRWCWRVGQEVETAALSLDMANAQASDARRAEDARLRAEVAW